MVHAWWGQTRCILGPDHPFCCAPMQFCCACNKSGPFWTLPRHSSATFYLKFRSRLRLIRGWNARCIFQETHQAESVAPTSYEISQFIWLSPLWATYIPPWCPCSVGYVIAAMSIEFCDSWKARCIHFSERTDERYVHESLFVIFPGFISFPATKWLQSGRNDSFEEIGWGSNSAMTCNKSLVTSPSTSRLRIVFSFFSPQLLRLIFIVFTRMRSRSSFTHSLKLISADASSLSLGKKVSFKLHSTKRASWGFRG